MPKNCSPRARFTRARKSILVTLLVPLLGVIGVLAVTFFGAATATAATSSYLNFQARLLTAAGSVVPDGNYNVEFKIYNASSSTGSSQGSCTGDAACQWVETRTSANQVRVVNGYLTVNLGSVNAFPSTMPWDQQLWLTMNIGGTGGTPTWDGEMNPRIQLTAVPYAFKAGAAFQIQNASYTTLLTTSGNQISLPNANGSSSALTFAGDTSADLYRSAAGVVTAGGYLNGTSGLQTNGTTRIDSGGNVVNVSNITSSGSITLTAGGVNAYGYQTTNTSSTYSGQWTLLGTCTINSQYQDCHSQIEAVNVGDGATTNFHAKVDFRVKQQNAMAGQPYVEVETSDLRSLTANQFVAVMTQNDASATVVSLYMQVNQSYQVIAFNPLINTSGSGSTHMVQWFSNQGYSASLPAGVGSPSQWTATYSNAILGTVSLQPAADAANVLQVENVAGSNILSVDTSATGGLTNIVTTSDMEATTATNTNWVSKGTSTVSQTTSQYYQGTHSVQAVITAASSGLQTSSFTTSILPSTQYQLTFYVRCSATISTFTYGRQDVSGTDINATTTSSCSSSGWTAYTWHFTTGATITSPNIYFTMGSATSGTIYLDAVSLIQTTTSAFNPYYNGGIQLNGVINTPTIIMPTASSTNALSVENATGTTTTLNVDTLNNRVNVGLPPTSSYGANLNVSGSYISRTNSTVAFQVQSSNGNLSDILNIDTSTTYNLLTNSDYEANGTSGWGAKNGATVSRVTTQAWQGNASLQVAGTTTANSGTSYSYTMAANTQYTLSVYAKVASGTISDFEIGHQDVSGTDIDCLTGQTLTTNWTRFTCTFTTGATITSSNIYFDKSGGTAETFFIDGAMLQTGANATPYNPGGGIMLEGLVNSPAVFQNKVDSATSFQVQNAAGTSNLLVADTLDNVIGIGQAPLATGSTLQVNGSISASSQIGFSNTGNANQGITLNMVVTSAVNAGDVVVIDTSNAGQVTDSTTANSTQVVGVATTTNASSGVAQPIVMSGVYQVNVTGAVSVGDYLVTSSTTGLAQGSTAPTGGVIGQALSTASGGKVWALIKPSSGSGGTTNTTINYNSYGLMESDWVDTGAALPSAAVREGASLVTIGNTIYMFGGISSGTQVNTIYSAPVSNPTSWTSVGTIAPASNGLSNSHLAIIGSTIYLFGGNTTAGTVNTIFSAPVSNPTSWTSVGTVAPVSGGVAFSHLAIIGSTIYLFGLSNSNAIYTAPVSNPLSWSSSGTIAAAPNGISQGNLAVIGSYVYIFGGYDSTNGMHNTIYRAPISNPLSWSNTGATLPGGAMRAEGMVSIIGNYIYYFGGYNGSSSTNTIFRAPLNNPVKGWVDTGSVLPSNLAYSSPLIAGNAVYLVGGRTAGSTSDTGEIYSAPIYNGSPDVSSNPSWITDSNYSSGGGSGTSSQTASGNYELAYGEFTGAFSTSATSEATAASIVSSPSYTYDGSTPVIVDFFASGSYNTSASNNVFELFEDGTDLGRFGTTANAVASDYKPLYFSKRITPSAGSHTFSVKMWVGGGTGYVLAGSSQGPGYYQPAYIRVTLANPQLQGGSGIANGTTTQTANFNVQSSSATSVTAVIQGATSQSADILDVRNSSNSNLLSVDAFGNLTVGGNIGFANTGNANQALTVNEVVTSAVTAGDVVVIDTSNAGQVTDSTSANSTKVFGIATQTKSAGQSQPIVISGIYQVNVSGVVNVGDYLVTSSTTGQAQDTTSPSGGIVGQAMSTASSGQAWVLVKPASGAGGSSGSSNNYGLMESDWTNTGATLGISGYDNASLVTIGNYIYMFGGDTGSNGSGSGSSREVLRALVSNPTSWTNMGSTLLPGNVAYSQVAVIGSYVYLFGGFNGSTWSSAIYRAPVSDPVNSWSNVGNLYEPLDGASLAIVGSTIYLYGGNNSSITNRIYTASTSNPLSWSLSSYTLPAALSGSQAAVIGNYVYLFGGENGSGAATNVIYRASISNPANMQNTSQTLGGSGLASSNLAIIGNYVYLFGGWLSGAAQSTILRSPVTNPLSWSTLSTVALPGSLAASSLAIEGNAVYLFGGSTTSASTNIIYSAPIINGSPDVSSNPSWITDSNYSSSGGSGTSSQTTNSNYELAYGQTTTQTTISSASLTSPTPVANASSFTADGSTKVKVEIYSPYWYSAAANGGTLFAVLQDNGTTTTKMGIFTTVGSTPATYGSSASVLSYEYIPSAGSHTLTFAAYENNGTAYVGAGTGIGTDYAPAYIRVTLANPQLQGGSGIANGTTTQIANFNVQSSSASNVTAVIQGATSQSADILDVRDSSSNNLLAVDANGNLTVKGNIQFANQGNANQGITLNMKVTSAVTAGDVVVIDTANAGQVTDSTSANSTKVFGIATQTKSAGQYQPIVVSGLYQVNVGSNSVSIGDYLVTDGTNGEAMASSSPTGGIVGQATSTASSNKVWALIKPASGTGGGSGGGMTTLYDSTLTSDTSSFDVPSIPGTYSQLKVMIYGRTSATTGSGWDQIGVRFNNDSGANYSGQKVEGNNTSSSINPSTGNSMSYTGYLPDANAGAGANFAGSQEITIPNYSSTTFYKALTSLNNSNINTTAAAQDASIWSGTWASTAAINRIQVLSANGANFKAGSRVVIYGVGGSNSGGGSSGSGVVGVQTYTSGSGTFNLPASVTSLQIEIVGGGGGGGLGNPYGSGSGGGAGAYVSKFISSPSSSYSYAVGAGGAPWGGGAHTNGGTTTFGTLSATGGTDGGGGSQPAAGTGGTGSGGDINDTGGSGNSGSTNYLGVAGGNGGASYFGSGGAGGNYGSNGSAGTAYGSGGGGAGGVGSSSLAGGSGAGGVIVITEYGTSLQGGGGIQNGTTLQIGANFNIQSASPSSVTATIHGTSGQSADILDVQNSSNVNLLSVDPSGNTFIAGNLNVGGTIGFSNIGNQNQGITLNMVVTSSVTAGDVVVVDTTTAGQVTDSTTANSTKVFGVATQTQGAGISQPIIVSGIYQVNVDTAAVNIGDYLVTSSTTGKVTATTSPSGGVIGQALSAKAAGSSGTIWARINPGNGAGGSGSGGAGYSLMESDFTQTGTIAAPVSNSQVVTVGNNLYMLGGNNNGTVTNHIYTATTVNPNSWTDTGNTIPIALMDSQAAIIGSNVYLFGGINSSGAAVQSVYYAPIANIANTASWSTATNVLPTVLGQSQLAIIGSTIYLFGGYTTSVSNVIYSASISNPLSWSANAGSTLPGALRFSQTAVIGNYVYLFGGSDASAPSQVIYRAPVSNPLSWSTAGATLNAKQYIAQLAIVGNYVYLFGGQDSAGNPTKNIQRAPVNDPVFGWSSVALLPVALAAPSVQIVGNALYLFGGSTGSFTNAIYSTPIVNGSPDISSNPSWKVDSNASSGGSGTSSQTANTNTELAYAQFTSTVTVTATTEGTAQTVVTAPSITADGNTPIIVQFGAPYISPQATATAIYIELFDGSTPLGFLTAAYAQSGGASITTPVMGSLRITPSAGSHTYSARTFLGTAGSGQVGAGPGGSGQYDPGFIRITLANPAIQGGSGIANGTTTQTANFNIQSASANNPTAVIQGAASQSADILDVRNSSNSNLLSVDASGNLAVTGSIGFSNSGNASQIMTVNEPVTTTVNQYDVVVIDTNNAGQVTTTTLANSTKVFGVATKTSGVAGATQPIAISGIYKVNVDTAQVNLGDYLVTSGTSGLATDSSSPSGGVIGQAMSAKSSGSNGTVWVRLNPGNGAGGSGSGANYGLMESEWQNTGATMPGTYPSSMYATYTVGSNMYLISNNQKIYTATTSNPTSWTDSGATFPVAIDSTQVVIVGSYIYTLGGHAGADTSAIYRASVSTPTSFSSYGNLPGAQAASQAAIIGNYVYLFGGDSGSYSSTIYKAPLSDLSTTGWATYGTAGNLAVAVKYSQLDVVGNYIYMFGGEQSGPSFSALQRAPISNPLSWTNYNAMPGGGIAYGQTAIIGNYVYIFGGWTSSSSYTSTIFRAPINDPLHSWAAINSTLPAGRGYSALTIAGNAVYLLGGSDSSQIWSAPIFNGGPDLSSNPSWKVDSNYSLGSGGSGTSSQTANGNYELLYSPISGGTYSTTATTDAGATTVVSGSFTASGSTPVNVQFSVPQLYVQNNGEQLIAVLFDNGSEVGRIGVWQDSNASAWLTSGNANYEYTPSAGSHTLTIGIRSGSGGTVAVYGNTGGVNTMTQGYMRVTLANPSIQGGSYGIQNATTTQTGNFNIQSASQSSVTAVIQGATSQSADILDVKNSTGTILLGVTATGKVNIGTSGTGFGQLEVNSTERISAGGNSHIDIRGGSDGSSSSSIYLYNPAGTLATVIGDGTYSSYIGGNLGINLGTAYTPQQALQVVGGIKISPTGDVNDGIKLYNNQANNPVGIIQQVWDEGGSTLYENLALNPLGGDVGIGTTGPGYKLDVVGVNDGIRITDNGGAGQQRLTFNATSGSTPYTWNIFGDPSSSRGGLYFANSITNPVTAATLALTTGGNVCIATYTCTHALGVNGSGVASGGFSTGTPDVAEYIDTSNDVGTADLVIADPTKAESVTKTSKPYDGAIVGVIADGTSGFQMLNAHYGSNFNANSDTTDPNAKPMTVTGRVPVKISDENGPVKPGDYLTSASTPGYAMKATHAGPTIGKALGFFGGSDTTNPATGTTVVNNKTYNTGKVLVLVNLSYYDPVSSELQGNALDATNTVVSGNLEVDGNAVFKGDIAVEGHIVGNADTSGTITVSSGSNSATYIFGSQYNPAPKVIVSPDGDTGSLHWWITKSTSDFTVHLSSSAPNSLNFDYMVQQSGP